MKLLDKIIEILIINGTLIEQPGLFYGKTGLAIFFFHYARHTGNELYSEYALELIKEVREQITTSTPVRNDIGLSGIGIGFEYLLQNNFLETENDNDFFLDLDDRIYRTVMYEPYCDLSMEKGFTGLGRYLIQRLKGKEYEDHKLHEALRYLVNEIVQKTKNNLVSKNEQPDVYRFFYDLVILPIHAMDRVDLLQYFSDWEFIFDPDVKNIFPYMSYYHRLNVCQRYFKKNLSKEIEQEMVNLEKSERQFLTCNEIFERWSSDGIFYLVNFDKYYNSWINIL